MNIQELRLTGFKSFAEPTRAPITAGLTGVVGPNGCGKSNLLEAVRWVMGVNSPKAMRGGEMDDVIFAGTTQRPARDYAEVVLLLDNSQGLAPAPFSAEPTLEISRRIRRGMGSTYRINGREARAKDVQLLFADASTGANSPALVRQGQISELIAAKPENRRRILEEAAGIGGLQARRHEADLKLRAAEANLERVEEVVTEIESLAAALRRQARQAERYRAVADDLRRVEALLFTRRISEARVQVGALDAERREAARAVAEAAENASLALRVQQEAAEKTGPAREEEMVAGAVLRRLEGVRVGLERDLRDAEAAIARLDAEKTRLAGDRQREAAAIEDADAAIARLATEQAQFETPADADAALDAAQQNARALETARAEAEAKLETAAAERAAALAAREARAQAAAEARARAAKAQTRLAALDAERARLPSPDAQAARAAALEAALTAAAAAADAAESERAAAEKAAAETEHAERAAFDPMRQAEAKAGEIAAEARALEKLAVEPEARKFPPALNRIKAKRGYERAVAAALGDDAEAALVREAPLRWEGAPIDEPSWPEGAEPLSAHVTAPPELAARLARCAIVDRALGPALITQAPPGARLVSREGDLWRWDGFVREAGAAPLATATRLEQQNRLDLLKDEREAAEAAMLAAQRAWEGARAARERAEARLKAARAAVPATASAVLQARAALDRHAAESERTAAALAAHEAQASVLRAEIEEFRAAPGDDTKLPAPDESALADLRAATEAARHAAAEARAALAALERDRAAREARSAYLQRERAAWDQRRDRAAARLAEITAGEDSVRRAHAAALEAPRKSQEALAGLIAEAEAAERRFAAATDALAAAEGRARETARAARTAEALHAQERETRASAEARFEAAERRVADVLAQARDQTGLSWEELPRRAGDLLTSPLARGPLADIERRADRLRAEREAAGPVNLRAEEELGETQARLEALQAEKADVAAAVAKLRRGIGELNAEGRARLAAAFDVVNGHFGALFATLFEGGEAHLKLVEPEDGGADPLAAGLEIFASPPGKKLSVLSLMSGGEQALTAAALIFAVFLANPAPLCVLDEVDAPLDDANVERFCAMLDEMRRRTDTRFLVITHNPMTMARMDRLYGVTMAERGVSQLVSVDLQKAAELAAA